MNPLPDYEEKKARAVEFGRLINQIENENDRTSAIVAGAYLDDLLTAALRSRMVLDAKFTKEAFEHEGFLSTYSAKNRLAVLIGLYTSTIYKDMRIMAHIRNDFAQNIKIDSFKNELVLKKCMNLKLVETNVLLVTPGSDRHAERNLYSTSYVDQEKFDTITRNPKERFLATFMILLNQLGTIECNPQRPVFWADPDKPFGQPSPS